MSPAAAGGAGGEETTSFIFNDVPDLVFQFMVLVRALHDLNEIEPGDPAFRSHLLAITGLVRYQFSFEEDLMDAVYGDMADHIAAHNRLRRDLAGLIEADLQHADTAARHAAFRRRLHDHLRDWDFGLARNLFLRRDHTVDRLRQLLRIFEQEQTS